MNRRRQLGSEKERKNPRGTSLCWAKVAIGRPPWATAMPIPNSLVIQRFPIITITKKLINYGATFYYRRMVSLQLPRG